MKLLFLIIAAIVLELYSLAAVLLQADSDRVLLDFLWQHGIASMLLAAFGWLAIPERFRQPRVPVLLLLFNFAFFVPVLGLLGMATAVLVSLYRRRHVVKQPFRALVLPEFVLSLREPNIQFGQGGIKSRLTQMSISTAKRLQSLLALQGLPGRVSSPLLQNMLDDTSEDIRLVAYGLLDNREKQINKQIHRELGVLKSEPGKELRLISLRHLAELYWELVYAGLAQGDLRLHALNQSLSCADEALQLEPGDTGLWFLKGRIYQQMHRNVEAYEIFEMTLAQGLPESRVLPYLAEIAFDRHDFAAVQTLLARLSETQITPIMRGAVDFWAGRGKQHVAPSSSGAGL